MIKNYLKIAFRNFWRHKLFTLINIIGLSIGISSALVIYLIVHYDFTFDKFHKDGDRIYRVVSNFTFSGEAIYNSGVTGPLPDAVKSGVTGLEESAPFYDQGVYSVAIPGKVQEKFKDEKGMVYADEHYFNIFSYKWIVGSPKTSLSGPFKLVLGSTEAKKYFPSLSYDQMIGKTVTYADSIKTTVTGVVEDLKENSDLKFDNFISFSTIQSVNDIKQQQSEWTSTNGSSQFFVKLAPKTAITSIEKQINAIYKKHVPTTAKNKGNKTEYRLQPLNDIHFNAIYYGMGGLTASKNMLYGLMVIGVFLLLLGCINFINLTTAQGSQRAKEIGIRKTMGSSRKQLIVQFLSETFLITLFAVIIAVSLTPVVLKLFSDFIAPGIKADFIHQPGIILFLILLSVTVSLLSGFYPAMILSGYKPVLVLKNQAFTNSGKTRNAWLRKSLTVTQFVIAQFFIMATILVSKQVYYAIHTDLGFKKDAIIYINTPWNSKLPGNKQILLDQVRSLSQVQMVSLGGDIPSSNGWSSRDVTYRDGKKEIKTELQFKKGDGNFIKVYHIKLLAGRNIGLGDSTTALLINDTYARILGFKNPQQALGKYFNYSDKQKMQIVGVIADFHQGSLHAPIKPLAITSIEPGYFSTLHIALKPQTPGGNEWKQAIASIEKSWKSLYPNDDFEYHFFDETIAKFYDSEQHASTLLTWATGLSIFISCLGLLGLAMYTTNLRTKEIGVRKVLGATVAQIVTLLSTELVLLVILAFVLVTPFAWWTMNRWMQDFSDRTTISWWIFALSGAGMLLAALLTLSFQTVKAAIANPARSLRSE